MLHIYFKQHLIHHKFKRENFLESPFMCVRFQGILEVFERKLNEKFHMSVIFQEASSCLILIHKFMNYACLSAKFTNLMKILALSTNYI